MHAMGMVTEFKEYCIFLGRESIEKYWKPTWRAIKARLKKDVEEKRKEKYLDIKK